MLGMKSVAWSAYSGEMDKPVTQAVGPLIVSYGALLGCRLLFQQQLPCGCSTLQTTESIRRLSEKFMGSRRVGVVSQQVGT